MSRTPRLTRRTREDSDNMAICNQGKVMAKIAWIKNVVALILRNNVNGNNKHADVVVSIKSIDKIGDASRPAEAGIEVEHDLNLDARAVINKILVVSKRILQWRWCGLRLCCWERDAAGRSSSNSGRSLGTGSNGP